MGKCIEFGKPLSKEDIEEERTSTSLGALPNFFNFLGEYFQGLISQIFRKVDLFVGRKE